MEVYSMDVIRDNQVFEKDCIRSQEDYTPEQWEALLNGEEVAVDWDEEGNPVEWHCINED